MPTSLTSDQLLLINLLLRVAVMAGITSLLLSFRSVTGLIMRISVTAAARARVAALFSAVFIVGVLIRRLSNQGAMDLSLEGTLLAGFLGGVWVGTGVGAAIGVVCYLFGETVALPFYAAAGLASGLLFTTLGGRGEVWNYSLNPFLIFYNFIERLARRRLDRNFIPFAAVVVFEVVRYSLIARYAGRRLFYGYHPHGTFLYTIDLAVAVYALGIALKMANGARMEIQLREEERQLTRARITTLRSQINPHFLFNTLNSISALIRTDAEQAREMTRRLASIFRKSLEESGETHPLRDEIEFIEDYLSIERVRFGEDKLRVTKEIDPGVLEVPVPIMILQPLVENAIKHGISKKVEGGELRIVARRANGGVEIEIENDGPPLADVSLSRLMANGVGLKNVAERINIYSCGAGRFSILPRAEGGARVRLSMPRMTDRIEEECR
jgi:two-component system LytT family sensor kinase